MKKSTLIASALTFVALSGGLVAITPTVAFADNSSTIAVSREAMTPEVSIEGYLDQRFEYGGELARKEGARGEELSADFYIHYIDGDSKVEAEFFVNGESVGIDRALEAGFGADIFYRGLLAPENKGKEIKVSIAFTITTKDGKVYTDTIKDIAL